MKALLKVRDVLEDTTREVEVEFHPEESLEAVLKKAGVHGYVDLDRYYRVGTGSYQVTENLPWVVDDGDLIIGATYGEVPLAVFWESHGVTDATLHVTENEVHSGGPGWIGAATTVAALIGFLANLDGSSNLIHKIWRKMRSAGDGPTALAFIDIVIERTAWSAVELAQLLKVTPKEAAAYLVLLGYEFDAKLRVFVQTERTTDVIKKIVGIDLVQREDP